MIPGIVPGAAPIIDGLIPDYVERRMPKGTFVTMEPDALKPHLMPRAGETMASDAPLEAGYGNGGDVVLPSVGGPVAFEGRQQFGMTSSRVVPTHGMMPPNYPNEFLKATGQAESRLPEPTQNTELRRQQLAMKLWHNQEEDIRRRVTMLENLIRRTVDLPTFDVVGAKKIKDDAVISRRHVEPNGKAFAADWCPFPVEGQYDNQVPEGSYYYQDPWARMKQAELEHHQETNTHKWRMMHPMTMAVAGDCQYVGRQLYLNPIDWYDPVYIRMFGLPMGGTMNPQGILYPRMA
jgi:hypothetical protein